MPIFLDNKYFQICSGNQPTLKKLLSLILSSSFCAPPYAVTIIASVFLIFFGKYKKYPMGSAVAFFLGVERAFPLNKFIFSLTKPFFFRSVSI
jgi:hypothetical protein